jgi:hypothetical protein
MEFQQGNQWWRKRAKHGRDKIITDVNAFIESCYEYFQSVESRPWKKKDWVGKDAIEVERECITPYTKSGLLVFLGVAKWETIESLKKDSADFLEAVTHIENVIRTQKLEGAYTGHFSATIASRDLGLTENLNHQNNGDKFTSTPVILADGRTLDDLYKDLKPE